MTEKEFFMLFRQAFLLMVDAIERKFDISPRTSDMRKNDRMYYVTANYSGYVPDDKED